MTLTADEIANKKFDTKMRGFNPNEVNDFLKQMAATVADLTEKNRELSEQVKANEEKLKYFTDLKDSLNKSILVAQEAAEEQREKRSRNCRSGSPKASDRYCFGGQRQGQCGD